MSAIPHSANIGSASVLTARGYSKRPRPDPYLSAPALALAAAATAAASCAAAIEIVPAEDGSAPEWIQLLPSGPLLEAVDGRRWQISDAAAVVRATNERRGRLKLCLDWEHSQERRAPRGRKAKAAGWITEVVLRGGAPWGRVEWTKRGAESVASKAYRYFSPSFLHERKIQLPSRPEGGEISAITGGGLVNSPAFDLPALASDETKGGQSMLERLLQALGLASGASEEQAEAAVKKLLSDLAEARSQAATASQSPPLDKFVPRADYDSAVQRALAAEQKIADASATALEAEIKRELDAALEAGKITPATRAYHEAQCRAEGGLDRFREFAEAAPEIAGASGVGDGEPGPAPSTAAQERVASALGLTPEFIRDNAGRRGGNS